MYVFPYKVFSFDTIEVGEDRSTIRFNYSFDDELVFTETITLPSGLHISQELEESQSFQKALQLYHFLAGTSYYKAYPTGEYHAESTISHELAGLLNNIYSQGLGEFMYVNQLEPESLVRFQGDDVADIAPTGATLSNLPLVLIGGGKDSLVTIAALQESDKDFYTFRVNRHNLVDQQVDTLDIVNSYTAGRQLDEKISKPNSLPGALNGHVPVTAILSALATITALVGGHSAIIVSNEASADIPNVQYKGLAVNHQYSKSFQFEQQLADYIHHEIADSLQYFSLLRPYTELKIAELFTKHMLDKVSGKWSSSNHNFKIGEKSNILWDIDYSAKGLAVYGLLAPFVGRVRLAQELGFENPFDEQYLSVWRQLSGKQDIKPFECVADIDEMRHALYIMQQSGEYPEIAEWDWLLAKYDYKAERPHRIPDEYQSVLQQLQD